MRGMGGCRIHSGFSSTNAWKDLLTMVPAEEGAHKGGDITERSPNKHHQHLLFYPCLPTGPGMSPSHPRNAARGLCSRGHTVSRLDLLPHTQVRVFAGVAFSLVQS